MYPNPIALNNGTAAVSFDLRSTSIDASQYKDGSAALDLPHVINIKHTTQGSGLAMNRRTLVRIDRTVEDANGNQALLSVYMVAVIPEKVATSAQVTEQVTLLKDFLTEAGAIAKIVAADI